MYFFPSLFNTVIFIFFNLLAPYASPLPVYVQLCSVEDKPYKYHCFALCQHSVIKKPSSCCVSFSPHPTPWENFYTLMNMLSYKILPNSNCSDRSFRKREYFLGGFALSLGLLFSVLSLPLKPLFSWHDKCTQVSLWLIISRGKEK